MSMRRKEVSQESSIAVQDNVIGLADGYANPFTKEKGLPMQAAAPAVSVPTAAGSRAVDLGVPVKMDTVHARDKKAAEKVLRNNSIFDKLALVAQHATGKNFMHSLNNVKKYIGKDEKNRKYLNETKAKIKKMLKEANGGDYALTLWHITNGMYDASDAKDFYNTAGKSIINLYVQASNMIAKLEFAKKKEVEKNNKKGKGPGKAAKNMRQTMDKGNQRLPMLKKDEWAQKLEDYMNNPENDQWKNDPYLPRLVNAAKKKKQPAAPSQGETRVPSTADA